jgi:hypothetical protein
MTGKDGDVTKPASEGGSSGVSKEEFDKLAKTVTNLASTLEKTVKGLETFGGSLSKIQSSIDGLKPRDPPKTRAPDKDTDLELLSRKEFLDLIMEKINISLDEKLKPVATRVEDVDSKALEKDLKEQVEKARAAHKDFNDWATEIGAQFQRNPNLSVEEAYTLARSSNANKSKELDEKYKSTSGEGRKEGGESKKPPFLGFTPTSGKSERNKKMTSKDAASAAWDEVMSSVELETGET